MANITKLKTKKGTSYRVRIRIKDCPTLSGTFKKKSEATAWAVNQESKIRMNKIMPELESKKHTVSDLINRYLDNIKIIYKHQYKRKKSHLKRFDQHFGFKKLSSLNKSDISEIIEILGSEKTSRKKLRKQSTVSRYLSTFNNCCKYGVNQLEWMPSNPVEKIKKPQESEPRNRFLEPDEFVKLLTVVSEVPKLRRIFLVLVFTGMRVGEALGVKYKDFIPEENAIILPKTKNKTVRRVDIYGIAFDELCNHAEFNKTRGKNWYLFGGNTSSNYQAYRRLLLACMSKCKIKDFGFHGLRHTMASYLAMNGASLQEIAHILGQKGIKMASRYSHLMDSHTKNKVKNLSESVINGLVKKNTR